MKAPPSNSHAAKAIPLAGFAELTLACTAVGLELAVVLARRTMRPAPIFAATATVHLDDGVGHLFDWYNNGDIEVCVCSGVEDPFPRQAP